MRRGKANWIAGTQLISIPFTAREKDLHTAASDILMALLNSNKWLGLSRRGESASSLSLTERSQERLASEAMIPQSGFSSVIDSKQKI